MVKINRPHIGIFGKMNVGKSSLLNVLTGQDVSIVSEQFGTTTDTVKKIIEILGIGPVAFVDTAGIDDSSLLGAQRVKRTNEALDSVDLAILVFAGDFDNYEQSLMETCVARRIPFFFVHNKTDLGKTNVTIEGAEVVEFSCKNPNVSTIFECIKKYLPKSSYSDNTILDDYVQAGDEVALVIPIDASAPEGRLILPQVQTLRNLLDIDAIVTCVKDTQLPKYLATHTPKLVITDSQVFGKVHQMVPLTIPLTSFSILFSRLKGDFESFLMGTPTLDRLENGDKILILESCSHSVNKCDDIGRVKIPNLIRKYTGKQLEFTVIPSLDPLPENLKDYKLAIQCGGCMVTRTQLLRRLSVLKENSVAISNYGLTIAYCNGIFERVTEIFRKKW